jgi:histidine triad (HIT) family protein
MDCIFCKIVRGESPAEIVREWAHVIAFNPLEPVTPGHTLIVPKEHVKDYTENLAITGLTAAAASEYASSIKEQSNLITSAGTIATQSVFHLHMHVVPRRRGDGLKLPWSGKNFS